MKTVNSVSGKCIPWHGMFARDAVTPVDDDGMPVLPGARICGRKDCVNTDHLGKGS
jgi:hypothetical protein